jgi:hypothetical protein
MKIKAEIRVVHQEATITKMPANHQNVEERLGKYPCPQHSDGTNSLAP